MLIRGLIILLFYTLCNQRLCAQEYVYKQLTRDHGLAGNKVYCAAQDKDGFIWFGTENGASRFDGNSFVNYTTADGLTDNEVLEIFSDSKGRTWFVCFTGRLCYYYKGKIYNTSNCPEMNSPLNRQGVAVIMEDRHGNIYFRSEYLSRFSTQNKFELLYNPDKQNIKDKLRYNCHGITTEGNFFFFMQLDPKTQYPDGSIRPLYSEEIHMKYPLGSFGRIAVSSFDSSNYTCSSREIIQTKSKNDTLQFIRSKEFDFQITRIVINPKNGDIYLSTRGKGIKKLNHAFELQETLLPGKSVGYTLIDRHENIWIATIGEGVFFLNASHIRLLTMPSEQKSKNTTAFHFTADGHLICGMEDGNIFSYEGLRLKKKYHFPIEYTQDNQLRGIFTTSNKQLNFVYNTKVLTEKGESKITAAPIKQVLEYRKDTFLYITGSGCYLRRGEQLDTLLYPERCTALTSNNTLPVLVASVKGLYQFVYPNLKIDSHYNIQRDGRIADMIYTPEGILWIATYNQGIKAYKNKKLYTIQSPDVLLSEQCRALYYEGSGKLWVVTNQGINSIQYDPKNPAECTIHSMTTADGLPSDLINQIGMKGDTVWVATQQGLAYFKREQIIQNTELPVYISQWWVNEKPSQRKSFSHDENRISISFAAISFSSGENILFRYRLKGLDQQWVLTKERRIEYVSLKPGNYTFEVQAIDKNGNSSKAPAELFFVIHPAFYDTWWFRICLFTALSILLYVLVRMRIKHIQKKELEKTRINKQFAELKLEAVRSQMDPHFVFNCLNAIQHFNIREDFHSAQKFMADFAKLIRKTLNHSKKDFVPLSEEVELLEVYIQLEKLRFEDLFEYEIIADNEVQALKDKIQIPSLIFQPYVENAINHGLKFLRNESGKLILRFEINDNQLLVSIEDNGIGILASKKLKESDKNQRGSLGISLNETHIDVINKIHELNIQYSITDLSLNDSTLHGTVVKISLPLIRKT